MPTLRGTLFALCALATLPLTAPGALPDHPVITEVYADPPGLNDGPVGRDPGNEHQEFIEIYLPPASALDPALDKDALRLTLYEVEGDENSSGHGLVNYRFDLPTFDLDSANGTTPGAVARPPGGVVVVGWVDYVGDPPADLAGTAASRVALIHGGITDTGGDYVFIAANGQHFGGTTNFPVVLAESLIDLPAEASSGVVQNGSSAFLLVDRDAAGYVELCDDQHAGDCAAGADPALPTDGLGLSSSALLDGFASNDHPKFDPLEQPYDAPTGDDIDLETVLPLGGGFSLLVPQFPEEDNRRPWPGLARGYYRIFPDVAKTTENGTPVDDDPVADALAAYRHVRESGPFYPTPGKAALTTSAPELSVASGGEQVFEALTETTGSAGILAANAGGDFGIDISVDSVTSDDPLRLQMSPGASAESVAGQAFGFPAVGLTPTASAAHGDVVTGTVTVTAANSQMGDPPVAAPMWMTTLSATVLNPTTGVDANGLPLQATVLAAIQPLVSDPGVANEFLQTDLGAFIAAQPDPNALSGMGNGLLLTDPLTDISDPLVVQPLIDEFPDLCCDFINPAGAPGTASLLQTVLNSAEVQSGAGTYDDAVATCTCPAGLQTAVRAVSINHPDAFVYGGTFSPSEPLQFADARGTAGKLRSGLANATTTRTFELAFVDTHVGDLGTLESGATDDFGIVAEVALAEAGAPVVTGEFVFLSFTGGLQGADIDMLPQPGVDLVGAVIYLDLDNLHDVLGIRALERLLLVDGSGNGQLDVIEIFCLNADEPVGCGGPAECNDDLFCTGLEDCVDGGCLSGGDPCAAAGLDCDEATDSCVCVMAEQCDDGLFCTGTETCDAGDCVSSGNPCTGMGLVCDEGNDLCVDTPACPGGSVAECADIDQNGVRDDPCMWWECVGGACIGTHRDAGQADLGGFGGACPIDGACDINDKFHAQNCFANQSTQGLPGYPCEPTPPSALNVDAVGFAGTCVIDGICDINDAFGADNCFANQDTQGIQPFPCQCGAPAPETAPAPPPAPVATTQLTLLAPPRARPGDLVEVEVYIDDPLKVLRGYQLHVDAAGGRRGALQLVDITVDEARADYAFAGAGSTPWAAFNIATQQMLNGLTPEGVAVGANSYLATMTFRVPRDAVGTFVIDLLHDGGGTSPLHRTFLFATPYDWIAIQATNPAVIQVDAPRSRPRRSLDRTKQGS